jgi:hypothetical protein
MHALRAAGARLAVVYPLEGDPKYPASVPLYANLGFRSGARTFTFVREE